MIGAARGRCLAAWLVLLTVTGCYATLPRVARPVTVSEARTLCSLDSIAGVSRAEALCIARLAGLDVRPGRATVRDDHALDGTPLWTVTETCDRGNPHCLGLAIRVADGRIVNERRLYLGLSRRGS